VLRPHSLNPYLNIKKKKLEEKLPSSE